MLANTGISPKVQEEIRHLARQYGLDQVRLFGSRARGDYRRASDIDLAVSGGDIIRFSLDLEEEAEAWLNVTLWMNCSWRHVCKVLPHYFPKKQIHFAYVF